MPTKKPQDPMSMIQDAMKASPIDMDGMKEQMKSSAEVSEKLVRVALQAAARSNELSSTWTKETLANVGTVAKVQDEPTDFTKAMTDFASAQGELATKNLSAFAEIAKAVQEQTIEIMMSAGKSFGEDAASAMQKASETVASATKPASK